MTVSCCPVVRGFFPCIQELVAVPRAHGLPVVGTEKVLLPGPNVFYALRSLVEFSSSV